MTTVFGIFTRLADWLVYGALGLDATTPLAQSLHFFVEDVSKIFAMVIVLIYLIGLFRAALDTDRVRDFLQGKHRLWGYMLAAMFGAITPFCSCSSIPLFLAFTSAGIPLGITMAFLITSPMINEVAIVLLGGTLGWGFTIAYVGVGLLAGVLGGAFFDLIKAEKHLTPLGHSGPTQAGTTGGGCGCGCESSHRIGWRARHAFAWRETWTIVGRIWVWVLVGIGIGAIMHGYVPREWIVDNLSADRWWTVPLAVVMGIPLYANASGVIPIAESLLDKGLPVGTTLALMMSVVGASLPEFLLLKQVMKPRLLVVFFLLLVVLFTLTGWLFNWAGAAWPGVFGVGG
jgi:uncharacterized protein